MLNKKKINSFPACDIVGYLQIVLTQIRIQNVDSTLRTRKDVKLQTMQIVKYGRLIRTRKNRNDNETPRFVAEQKSAFIGC